MNEFLKTLLNDVYVKFVMNHNEFIFLDYRLYLFIVEEAYWYSIDNYVLNNLSFRTFAALLLMYSKVIPECDNVLNEVFKLNMSEFNESKIVSLIEKYKPRQHKSFPSACDKYYYYNNVFPLSRLNDDLNHFNNYKRSVPVYGCMIFSPDLSKFLIVKQTTGSTYTFPKGKRIMNEDPKICAVRETMEEVGIDVTDHITCVNFTIFKKITLYVVLNIDPSVPVKPRSAKEIAGIEWINIEDFINSINSSEECFNSKYKLVIVAFRQFLPFYENLKSNLFKFKFDQNDDNLNDETDANKRNNSLIRIMNRLL
ncbi:DCP2 [Hepatospora eriocheir]|uniref:DCP2 n=1 Tax=Hepatospora eriocheir TaxID=1081669 RepID=A0A1X0QEX9_9MICR|nr:DCP2 [Hepatospora eriocheir]